MFGSSETASTKPTLRERNRAQTRQRILQACVEIELVHGGLENPDVFTFARVAELAGVSERTVYRMFPTKRDLASAYIDSHALLGGREQPPAVAEYPEFIRTVTREWSATLPDPLPRRELPGDSEYPEAVVDRRHRDRMVLDHVERLLPPDLPPRQRLAVAAALHSAISLRAIVASASRWGLTLAEAGEAHAWALETLIKSLESKELPPWELTPPPSVQ